jgi:NAD(P)-dependent dehydrogenase (short-subunit alcohol dehydrogenase family)
VLHRAGLTPHAPPARRKIDVNIMGVWHGIASALPHRKQRKAGDIIHVSPAAGHKAGPGSAVDAVSKHAVRAVPEGLRQGVKRYYVRAGVIAPRGSSDKTAGQIGKLFGATAISAIHSPVLSQTDEVGVNVMLFRPSRRGAGVKRAVPVAARFDMVVTRTWSTWCWRRSSVWRKSSTAICGGRCALPALGGARCSLMVSAGIGQ